VNIDNEIPFSVEQPITNNIVQFSSFLTIFRGCPPSVYFPSALYLLNKDFGLVFAGMMYWGQMCVTWRNVGAVTFHLDQVAFDPEIPFCSACISSTNADFGLVFAGIMDQGKRCVT
jgi:hypothetical protein